MEEKKTIVSKSCSSGKQYAWYRGLCTSVIFDQSSIGPCCEATLVEQISENILNFKIVKIYSSSYFYT